MGKNVILSVDIYLFIVFIKYRIFFGKILILKLQLLLNSNLTVKYSEISDGCTILRKFYRNTTNVYALKGILWYVNLITNFFKKAEKAVAWRGSTDCKLA